VANYLWLSIPITPLLIYFHRTTSSSLKKMIQTQCPNNQHRVSAHRVLTMKNIDFCGCNSSISSVCSSVGGRDISASRKTAFCCITTIVNQLTLINPEIQLYCMPRSEHASPLSSKVVDCSKRIYTVNQQNLINPSLTPFFAPTVCPVGCAQQREKRRNESRAAWMYEAAAWETI
jgi:hypothetical protein